VEVSVIEPGNGQPPAVVTDTLEGASEQAGAGIRITAGASEAQVIIDQGVCSREVVFQAALAMTDRCTVAIERGPPAGFVVTLAPRETPPGEEACRAMAEAYARAFADELPLHRLRQRLLRHNREAREYLFLRAHFGESAVSSQDRLLADLMEDGAGRSGEPDPSAIATPWEEAEPRRR
jgi:hypothetical protein